MIFWSGNNNGRRGSVSSKILGHSLQVWQPVSMQSSRSPYLAFAIVAYLMLCSAHEDSVDMNIRDLLQPENGEPVFDPKTNSGGDTGMSVVSYGFWCGVNNDKKLDSTPPPIDGVDRACMEHDFCLLRDKKFPLDCDKALLLGVQVALDESRDDYEPVEPEARDAGHAITSFMSLKMVFGAFTETQHNEHGRGDEYRKLLMGDEAEYQQRQADRRAELERKRAEREAKRAAKLQARQNQTAAGASDEDEEEEEEEQEGEQEVDSAGFFRLLDMFSQTAQEMQDKVTEEQSGESSEDVSQEGNENRADGEDDSTEAGNTEEEYVDDVVKTVTETESVNTDTEGVAQTSVEVDVEETVIPHKKHHESVHAASDSASSSSSASKGAAKQGKEFKILHDEL